MSTLSKLFGMDKPENKHLSNVLNTIGSAVLTGAMDRDPELHTAVRVIESASRQTYGPQQPRQPQRGGSGTGGNGFPRSGSAELVTVQIDPDLDEQVLMAVAALMARNGVSPDVIEQLDDLLSAEFEAMGF